MLIVFAAVLAGSSLAFTVLVLAAAMSDLFVSRFVNRTASQSLESRYEQSA